MNYMNTTARAATGTPAIWKERFLRLPDVCQLIGLRKTAIYQRIKEGSFPKPIPLSGQRVAWLESEVRTWMQNRVAQRPDAVAGTTATATGLRRV